MRVAVYARVSTSRQAEHDLSLPEQIRAAKDYCTKRQYHIVEVFEERGVSATTTNRPELNRLREIVRKPYQPFDIVLVYNLSRLFRNSFEAARFENDLEKRSVRVVSICEDFSDDPNGRLTKSIIQATYQHQSEYNAENVKMAMKANAEAGFWNGSRPPFGYRTIIAEVRGTKEKKKLEPHPDFAPIVQLAFELYAHGDGSNGPLGVKAVASNLNGRGLTNARGNPFTNQFVGKLLRNEAYTGAY